MHIYTRIQPNHEVKKQQLALSAATKNMGQEVAGYLEITIGLQALTQGDKVPVHRYIHASLPRKPSSQVSFHKQHLIKKTHPCST